MRGSRSCRWEALAVGLEDDAIDNLQAQAPAWHIDRWTHAFDRVFEGGPRSCRGPHTTGRSARPRADRRRGRAPARAEDRRLREPAAAWQLSRVHADVGPGAEAASLRAGADAGDAGRGSQCSAAPRRRSWGRARAQRHRADASLVLRPGIRTGRRRTARPRSAARTRPAGAAEDLPRAERAAWRAWSGVGIDEAPISREAWGDADAALVRAARALATSTSCGTSNEQYRAARQTWATRSAGARSPSSRRRRCALRCDIAAAREPFRAHTVPRAGSSIAGTSCSCRRRS